MEFSVKSGNAEKQRIDCVVVGVFENRKLSEAATRLDKASRGFISNLFRRGDLQGKKNQTLMLHSVPEILCTRVLIVGCGPEKEFNDKGYREANAAAAKAINESGATQAMTYLTDLNVEGRDVAWKVRQCVEATEDALYRFEQLKSKKDKTKHALKRLVLSVSGKRETAPAEQAIKVALGIAAGVRLAKDLGNLPGNICTPAYLANQARTLQKHHRKIHIKVVERTEMEKLGMGALLSVARGSRQPPKLIIIDYRGGTKHQKPVALVGKGVTFDSGGISLKPGQAMDEMKFDMCGAASVLGTLSACASLALPLNVIGVIPATENLPDGAASKPGDIVTTMSGQTVEILNTDAEGRLILCDALTYTERFEPQAVIDIATLTGACVIALGSHACGLLGNDTDLSDALLDAGRHAGDRAWQLPLWDEYQEQLKSNFADMANIGGREAGTITAACFLSRFTKKFHWAHLDIAGVAWNSGANKGATGRPVALLTQYLLGVAGQK